MYDAQYKLLILHIKYHNIPSSKFILSPSFSFGFLFGFFLLFRNFIRQTRILSFPESFLPTDVILEGELVLEVEVPVLYVLFMALNQRLQETNRSTLLENYTSLTSHWVFN